MTKLVVLSADGTMLDVPLKRERMTIGRRADNDICLPNLAVSGEHAAVVTILADSFLEDLGSTNGTLVNGAPISKHLLRDGDQIDIGRHILVFCVDEDTVLAAGTVRGPSRSAVGDLGERVEAAKPFVRQPPREASPSAMRRDRVAANAAAKRGPPSVPAAETTRANAVVAPPRPPPRAASLKVLSGPGEGRSIPIAKVRTTIGRAGVQVALIIRTGDTHALSRVEGDPPRVNGALLEGSEAVLAPGDVIEIAGARLEFTGLPQAVEAG
jgi:pSer/pThr/pTyr-binding forkhead associated (FHA) protein